MKNLTCVYCTRCKQWKRSAEMRLRDENAKGRGPCCHLISSDNKANNGHKEPKGKTAQRTTVDHELDAECDAMRVGRCQMADESPETSMGGSDPARMIYGSRVNAHTFLWTAHTNMESTRYSLHIGHSSGLNGLFLGEKTVWKNRVFPFFLCVFQQQFKRNKCRTLATHSYKVLNNKLIKDH